MAVSYILCCANWLKPNCSAFKNRNRPVANGAFAIGLFMLTIKLLPVVLLIYATVVISRKIPGTPARLLAVGAILLAAASLDTPFNYFIAFLLDTHAITSIIVFSSVVFEGLNIVALVLLSLGLVKLSTAVAKKGASE